MSEKSVLTDRALKAVKPAEKGKRYVMWDKLVPSFGARVTDTGSVSFIVMRRLDGKLIRRTIGEYGVVNLVEARESARAALLDIGKGVDPKAKAQEAREARELAERDKFKAVAEDFIKKHVPGLRTAREVEAAVRKQLISRWASKPISKVTKRDVFDLINEVAEESGPYAAHKILAYASKLFNWAIARDIYGIQHSPCDRIKPSDAIGKKEARQRILTDAEIRVFWNAADGLDYPFGPLFKFLLLTGQRRDEAAESSWSEIDLTKNLWTIPASRMKADAPHVVPLAPQAVELLANLPRFDGEFVFTTTDGERPVSGFSKAKARIDRDMLKKMQGSDPAAKLDDWRLHDLRRTARTHFSALPSSDMVRELAIAHTRPGLHKVYDQFAYIEEKRALFDAWAMRLAAIINPPDKANVLEFRGAVNG